MHFPGLFGGQSTCFFFGVAKISVTCDNSSYSGTIAPTLLQKSHLTPLPPSHVYAFTIPKSFTSPGSLNSEMFDAVLLKLVLLNAVPPVWFRFNCTGFAKVHAGKSVAAIPNVEPLADAPFATEVLIEGLFVVMKLPQIVWKARLKSGPWLGLGGPK